MSRLSAADLKAIEQMVATVRSPKDEPVSADERVNRHWWGEWDEDVSWALGMAAMVNEPVAKYLYEWHCAGDMAGVTSITLLQAWCATTAAEFARTKVGRNKQPRIRSFRLDWGRQAAHDGAALAMWDNPRASIRDDLPGINVRAAKYGCSDEAYMRVREHVRQEAQELIFRFRRDVEMALAGRFDPDFRCRWERKTGKLWPRHG